MRDQTLPNDGMIFRDSILLEHDIQCVDAMVICYDSTGAANLQPDDNLYYCWITLNLF